MLNQSADYAVRAVLFVARRDGGRACTAKAIAGATGIPYNYLGKVLHALVNAGVLTSLRGPQGGFRLAADPSELTLADVTGPFQRMPERRTCLLGDRPCDATQPCVSHQHWQKIAEHLTGFFRMTTISAMLADLPPEAPSAMPDGHCQSGDVATITSSGRSSICQ